MILMTSNLDLIAINLLDRDDIADLVSSRDAIEVAWYLINLETDLEVEVDQLAETIKDMILDPFNH
jgi:hypothetical protein